MISAKNYETMSKFVKVINLLKLFLEYCDFFFLDSVYIVYHILPNQLNRLQWLTILV